ncbi:EamA-like transporter family protein [Planctomycetes bacterium Pan216]|uniref:EamA-like transporter family protein n=1 Tax=Kolteria novifilia TaxID=2527975 RepID=A0A518B6I4_9BACT|nr:EamA-like transporter family protein [Planctomycetes bacterium Pan216]
MPISPSARGRLLVLTAAILWSTSGSFVKNIDVPDVAMAAIRALVAGSFMAAWVAMARVRLTWSWLMLPMMLCYMIMNYLFIGAVQRTTAANVIFLQYTAPLWMFLGSVLLLGERADRRSLWCLTAGMIGILVILIGHASELASHGVGLMMGLTSGFFYGSVALFLRGLSSHDTAWLVAMNNLAAGMVLVVVFWVVGGDFAGWGIGGAEFGFLCLFGIAQLGIPYLVFGMGLRTISPQEAGLITLIEPVLNTWLTYVTAGEAPSRSTIVGGAILLLSISLRYLPFKRIASPLWFGKERERTIADSDQ